MKTPAVDPVDDFRMPILDHIRELRDRLIRSLWVLAVTLGVSFFFSRDLFDWIAAPMNQALRDTGTGTLAVTEATEGLLVQMKVAGLSGLFLASPFLFFQIWQFVSPGLYDQEKKHVVPLAFTSTVLFVTGAAFAYFGVFKFGFPFFLQMNGPDVTAVLSINSYLTFAMTLLVAFGAAFQLPVVIFFLARLGIINHRDLIRGFRYSIVAIAIVAAILTPPDILSMALMGVPLVLLYGVGIGVAYVWSTKKAPTP